MPSRHTASFKNIAQHHASKMSSLKQPASMAYSQSPSFTNLSWMEINASVGPPGCSCTLSTLVSVCMPCVFVYRALATYKTVRNPSSMDTTLKKKLLPFAYLTCSRLSFVLWWAFRLQGISVCRRDVSPNIVVYHTSGWRDGKKKTKGRRKEPVFHPISFERQCCALVIE